MKTPRSLNHLAFNHGRFLASLFIGCASFFLAPERWGLVTRVLVGWDCGVMVFLVWIYRWMTSLTAEQICVRFVEEDETAPVILATVTLAALLSLVAIVALLSTAKSVTGEARSAHFLLAGLTVAASWVLVPTIFTVHYADLFYSAKPGDRPLQFPKTAEPVFWDFAYFSFTIAAACQTSDVSTTEISIRKAVIAHTILSFLFNAAVLGFAINVSAGLLNGN